MARVVVFIAACFFFKLRSALLVFSRSSSGRLGRWHPLRLDAAGGGSFTFRSALLVE